MFNSSDNGAYKKSASIQNKIDSNLNKHWSHINQETSDYAITNRETNSVFMINSACRKFEAGNLNSLTSAILNGVEIVKIIDKKIITFQDRDAVDMTIIGKVDGVARYFHLITTQKNNCIYDFVLIATNEKNFEMDNRDYLDFIQKVILQ